MSSDLQQTTYLERCQGPPLHELDGLVNGDVARRQLARQLVCRESRQHLHQARQHLLARLDQQLGGKDLRQACAGSTTNNQSSSVFFGRSGATQASLLILKKAPARLWTLPPRDNILPKLTLITPLRYSTKLS